MKRYLWYCGVWIEICLLILIGDFSTENHQYVEVYSEKKMTLNLEEAIPDANFRMCLNDMVTTGSIDRYDDVTEEWVTTYYTVNGVKYDSLTEENLQYIIGINCRNRGITNITGIELLSNLWDLDLGENKIDKIELNSVNNPKLYQIWIDNTKFKQFTLDEALYNQVAHLDVSNNNLTNDDIKSYISKFRNLVGLAVGGNKLSNELDVSSLNRLGGIWASNTDISSIKGLADKEVNYTAPDGKNKTSHIQYLNLSNTKVNNIDVSNNPNLLYLNLAETGISNINLSNNSKIRHIILPRNKLTSIDLSNNKELRVVDLSGNTIPEITVMSDYLRELWLSNTKFSNLIIQDNNPGKLEQLDITNSKMNQEEIQNLINSFPNLKNLVVNYNSLSNLNVSNLSKLESLNAAHNKLSSLDLSNNGNLKSLAIEFNGFGDHIDLNKNNKIQYLSVNSTFAKNFNFSIFPDLKQLDFSYFMNIPVYGTSLSTKDLMNYIPFNITNVSDYKFYDNFVENSLFTNDIINGELGKSINVRIKANKATNNEVMNFSGVQKFQGYYTLKFMKLTSDKYVIDEVKNIIDVGGDSDDVIRKNLKMSWEGATFTIQGNKLTIKYNGMNVKEFTLQRIVNPKTGDLFVALIVLLGVVGGGTSIIIYRRYIQKKI